MVKILRSCRRPLAAVNLTLFYHFRPAGQSKSCPLRTPLSGNASDDIRTRRPGCQCNARDSFNVSQHTRYCVRQNVRNYTCGSTKCIPISGQVGVDFSASNSKTGNSMDKIIQGTAADG